MKVNTALKSGNVISDASNLISQGTKQVVDFVSAAGHQAGTVTDTVAHAVQSAWNSLTGWIKP